MCLACIMICFAWFREALFVSGAMHAWHTHVLPGVFKITEAILNLFRNGVCGEHALLRSFHGFCFSWECVQLLELPMFLHCGSWSSGEGRRLKALATPSIDYLVAISWRWIDGELGLWFESRRTPTVACSRKLSWALLGSPAWVPLEVPLVAPSKANGLRIAWSGVRFPLGCLVKFE